MPEPNRLPWQVQKEIAPLYGWQILQSGLTLVVECDACSRVVEWPPRFVARYFANLKRVRMPEIASRLRCGKCRSNWVKVCRVSGDERINQTSGRDTNSAINVRTTTTFRFLTLLTRPIMRHALCASEAVNEALITLKNKSAPAKDRVLTLFLVARATTPERAVSVPTVRAPPR